jgi:hypothetical protein
MKTETELNENILKITAFIKEKFPELLTFIGEMPVKMTYKDNEEPGLKSLEEYYNSLQALVKKYSLNHEGFDPVTNVT